jgi:hypothetical protein
MKTFRRIIWRVRVWWVRRAESRAFFKAHGPVVSIEPTPKGETVMKKERTGGSK